MSNEKKESGIPSAGEKGGALTIPNNQFIYIIYYWREFNKLYQVILECNESFWMTATGLEFVTT